MRKLIDLIESNQLDEAPLADFEFHGDPETPGTIGDDDLRAVRNPKWHAKLIKMFQNIPFPVNVYILNGKNGLLTNNKTLNYPDTEEYAAFTLAKQRERATQYPMRNAMDYSAYSEEISGCYQPNDFKTNFGFLPPNYENSLSVMFTHNIGDERLPFTPWIVAHRIIHMMAGPSHHWTRNSDVFMEFNLFWRPMNEVITWINSHEEKYADRVSHYNNPDLYKRVSNLKSAQNGLISRPGEFLIELATQAFLKGDFVFDIDGLKMDGRDYVETKLAAARAGLQSTFDASIGKMFVL